MIGFRERNQQGGLLAISLVITGLALLQAIFGTLTPSTWWPAHSIQAIAITPRQLYAR